MDAGNQIYFFSLCLLVGYASGIIYEIFSFFRWIFACERGKYKILGIVLDVLFFIFFAIWSVFVAKSMQFPNFRAYMWIAYMVGWALYLKSLHRMLDFLKKVCYNFLKEAIKGRKMSKNSTFREEKKI